MPLPFSKLPLICSIILSLCLEASASPREGCGIIPAPAVGPDGDVTSSTPSAGASSALLESVTTITVPGIERFPAADYFREHQPAGQLQITWIGKHFREHFLSKIETQVSAGVLTAYRLRQSAYDSEITAGFGEHPQTVSPKTMLYDVWSLLSCQSHGENGPLLTNATPNIFYVHDTGGVLWSIDALWSGAGWEIGASSLDDPRPWRHGRQVILRQSNSVK
jgi:hypothetical protein